MKKLFLLLTIFLSIGLLISCSDDHTVTTENSVTVTFDNVAVIDGVIYTTQDYPLEIESMELTSSDGATKCIAEAEYSIDSELASKAIFTPFSGRIDTTGLEPGSHILELSFNLLQNDNSIMPDDIVYSIVIVPTVKDLPNNLMLGSYTRTFHPTHS